MLLSRYYKNCYDFFLAQCHLPAADRISMAFSYELRVPFLQKRILNKYKPKNTIFYIIRSLNRKKYLIKYINKILKRKYKIIPKSGFGTDTKSSFSNDAIVFIDSLITYGNAKGFINEKVNLKTNNDSRLFIHLINQAHYVFLLRKIFDWPKYLPKNAKSLNR